MKRVSRDRAPVCPVISVYLSLLDEVIEFWALDSGEAIRKRRTINSIHDEGSDLSFIVLLIAIKIIGSKNRKLCSTLVVSSLYRSLSGTICPSFPAFDVLFADVHARHS